MHLVSTCMLTYFCDPVAFFVFRASLLSCGFQTLLDKVSKELEEVKDSSAVLRKHLAEMMNNLMTDLVSAVSGSNFLTSF